MKGNIETPQTAKQFSIYNSKSKFKTDIGKHIKSKYDGNRNNT